MAETKLPSSDNVGRKPREIITIDDDADSNSSSSRVNERMSSSNGKTPVRLPRNSPNGSLRVNSDDIQEIPRPANFSDKPKLLKRPHSLTSASSTKSSTSPHAVIINGSKPTTGSSSIDNSRGLAARLPQLPQPSSKLQQPPRDPPEPQPKPQLAMTGHGLQVFIGNDTNTRSPSLPPGLTTHSRPSLPNPTAASNANSGLGMSWSSASPSNLSDRPAYSANSTPYETGRKSVVSQTSSVARKSAQSPSLSTSRGKVNGSVRPQSVFSDTSTITDKRLQDLLATQHSHESKSKAADTITGKNAGPSKAPAVKGASNKARTHEHAKARSAHAVVIGSNKVSKTTKVSQDIVSSATPTLQNPGSDQHRRATTPLLHVPSGNSTVDRASGNFEPHMGTISEESSPSRSRPATTSKAAMVKPASSTPPMNSPVTKPSMFNGTSTNVPVRSSLHNLATARPPKPLLDSRLVAHSPNDEAAQENKGRSATEMAPNVTNTTLDESLQRPEVKQLPKKDLGRNSPRPDKRISNTSSVNTPAVIRSATPFKLPQLELNRILSQTRSQTTTTIQKRSPQSLSELEKSLEKIIKTSAADQTYTVTMIMAKSRHFCGLYGDDVEVHAAFKKTNAQDTVELDPEKPKLEAYRPNGMTCVRMRSPMSDMKARSFVSDGKYQPSMVPISIELPDSTGKRIVKGSMTYLKTPFVTWTDNSSQLPSYTQCTAVTKNVAAPNHKILHFHPYFGENVSDEVYEALRNRYDMDTSDRTRKVAQNQQAHRLQPYVDEFFATIACTEQDVLYYLLAPATVAPPEIFSQREKSCKDDFDRTSDRWARVFKSISPAPDESKLQIAAWACSAFLKQTGLSLWHVVRKSRLAAPQVSDDEEDISKKTVINQIQHLSCRVCHEHDCPYHKDYMEVPHSDDDDESLSEIEMLDIDWPPNFNYERRVTLPSNLEERPDSADEIRVGRPQSRDKQAYRQLLQNLTETTNHERNRFYPCYHPGRSCQEEFCKCARDGVLCEKACGCSASCERRFLGCTCHAQGRRGACFKDDRCDCSRLNRECDADLCKGCRADAVLDPVNRDDETVQKLCCHNVSMQLGIPKRTILGKSRIHGYGVYAGEPIKKGDFVGEYSGELTLPGERIRRGEIYEIQKLSYLFMLTEDQEVDSHHVGNKMRFVNHAEQVGKLGACNLQPSIKLCNMTPRIGMYAVRDIEIGEELFFDYGDHYQTLLQETIAIEKGRDGKVAQRGKVKKLTRRKKNTELTKGFAEPEYEDFVADVSKSKKVTPRYDKSKARAANHRLESPAMRSPKSQAGTASKSMLNTSRHSSLRGEVTPMEDIIQAASDGVEKNGSGEEEEDISDQESVQDIHIGARVSKRRRHTIEDSDTEWQGTETPRRSNRSNKRRRFTIEDEDDDDEDDEDEEIDERTPKKRSSGPVVNAKRGRGRPKGRKSMI